MSFHNVNFLRAEVFFPQLNKSTTHRRSILTDFLLIDNYNTLVRLNIKTNTIEVISTG